MFLSFKRCEATRAHFNITQTFDIKNFFCTPHKHFYRSNLRSLRELKYLKFLLVHKSLWYKCVAYVEVLHIAVSLIGLHKL